MLLSSLDFTRYSPRIYFISQGDTLSERKAIALEASKAADYHLHLVRVFFSDIRVSPRLNVPCGLALEFSREHTLAHVHRHSTRTPCTSVNLDDSSTLR